MLAQIANTMDAGASSKSHAGAGVAYLTGKGEVNSLFEKSVLPSSTVEVRLSSLEHINQQFRRTNEGKYVCVFCTWGPVLHTHAYYQRKLLERVKIASIAKHLDNPRCAINAAVAHKDDGMICLKFVGTAVTPGRCGKGLNEQHQQIKLAAPQHEHQVYMYTRTHIYTNTHTHAHTHTHTHTHAHANERASTHTEAHPL